MPVRKYFTDAERKAAISARQIAWGAANSEKRCEQARARYAANPEKHREQFRARYAANPEKLREQVRARRAANPEKHREQARARRAANPEKHREKARARYAVNPEKHRERHRAWFAAERDAKIIISKMRLAGVDIPLPSSGEKPVSARRLLREVERQLVELET